MTSILWTLLILIGAFILVPVMAYMVMKFGAAGYFRAKRREEDPDLGITRRGLK